MRQGLRSEPGTSTHYNIIIIRIITILLLQQGFIHEVLNSTVPGACLCVELLRLHQNGCYRITGESESTQLKVQKKVPLSLDFVSQA